VLRNILIATTLIASWLGMQLIHEIGHVVGAHLTGGSVERVVFYPLELSRTDLAHNPRPLVVVWAGPVMGTLIPLFAWAGGVVLRASLSYLMRFFAGFCLVANGAYIGAGVFGRIGDSATMLVHGSSAWMLLLFALATVPLGLWLWHGEGSHFGLGPVPREVSAVATVVTTALCIVLVVLGCTMGHL
jgi:hypothetical protein